MTKIKLSLFRFWRQFFKPKKRPTDKLIAFLGFIPKDITYYEMALRHPSATLKDANGLPINNERLEFLGDAVFELVITEALYQLFPDKQEGFLSEMRSKVVCRRTLAQLGEKMGLPQLLHHNTNGVAKNIYGNAMEAIFGAIFIEAGYAQCREFAQKQIFNKHLNLKSLQEKSTDYKSRLLQWGQKNGKNVTYEQETPFQSQTVPFVAWAIVEGEKVAMGCGYSKRESEQAASKETLNKLHIAI